MGAIYVRTASLHQDAGAMGGGKYCMLNVDLRMHHSPIPPPPISARPGAWLAITSNHSTRSFEIGPDLTGLHQMHLPEGDPPSTMRHFSEISFFFFPVRPFLFLPRAPQTTRTYIHVTSNLQGPNTPGMGASVWRNLAPDSSHTSHPSLSLSCSRPTQRPNQRQHLPFP